MRIFTSYFGRTALLQRSGIVPIGIALWLPRWYSGKSMKSVDPTAYMVKGDITQDRYVELYNKEILGKLRVEEVVYEIERLSGGKDAALLCYEKPGDFCHRHLLADWLTRESGLVVEEFDQEKHSTAQPQPETVSKADNEPTLF